MASLGNLSISMYVDTTGLVMASRALKQFAGQSAKTLDKVGLDLDKLGKKIKGVGMSLTTSITMPMGLVAGGALKMAADFEYSMAKIHGLVGVSKQQVADWADEIKKMGPELGKSPKELADAMYFITSAGIRGAEAMDILNMSAKASVAGLGEVKTVADLVTSAVNAYGVENMSAAEATDILVAAVREGKAEATQMAGAMGKVLPIASQMGVSFNEVSASVASMTRTGTDANTAAIQLRQMLNSLQKPSKQAEAAMNSMGTSAAELRNTIREEGLLVALQDLSDLSEIYGETVFSKVFPNIRAMTGAFDIMGKNAENNVRIFDALNKAAGGLDVSFLAVSDTLKVKWDKALSSTNSALIELGLSMKSTVIPLLEKLTEKIKAVTEWWNGLSTETQKSIIMYSAIVAAIGPVIFIFGTMITTVSKVISIVKVLSTLLRALWVTMATNPILLVIGAVAAITVAMYKWQKSTTGVKKETEALNDVLKEAEGLRASFFDLQDTNAMMGDMNTRQLEDYIRLLKVRKAKEEDMAFTANAIVKNRLKTNEQYQQAILDMENETNKSKLQSHQIYISTLKQQIGGMEAVEAESAKKRLGILNDYIKGAEQAYADLKKAQNSGKGGKAPLIDPAVATVMTNLQAQLDYTARKAALMGDEWEATSHKVDIYKTALEGLLNIKGSPEELIKEYYEQIKKLSSTLDESVEPIDTFWDSWDKITNIELNLGDSFDETSELLKLVTERLEALGNAGITSGDEVALLKSQLSMLNSELTKGLSLEEMMNKELERSKKFHAAFGTQLSLTSEQFDIYTKYLEKMYMANELTTEQFAAMSASVNALSEEFIFLKEKGNVLKSLGDLTSKLAVTLGKSLTSTGNAAQAMVSLVLSALTQMIAGMLAATMSAVLLGTSKKWGLAGLLFAGTVGLAALSAIWSKVTSETDSMSKMAKGGIIPSGYPNDTFPAMLSSNEAVIPLDRINSLVPNNNNQGRLTGTLVLEGGELLVLIEQAMVERNSIS